MKSNTKKNNIKLSLAPPSFVPHSFVPHYAPKNENQKKYVTYLQDPAVSIVLGVGPAGTGKTLFACNHAIRELKYGNIDKIVLTRPVVPVEEDLGFLPGNLVSKMDPWTRPLFDLFLEYYSKMELDSMLKSNIIEVSPLAYMRGRTFKRSFIIADEMQNCSPNQMFMITTRIGEQSKMVITGDLKQSDRGQENGLWDFLNKITPLKIQEQPLEINELQDTRFVNLRPLKNIGLVEFENTDIERSEIVRTIIELYNPEKKGNH
jgi:phosphate starvation-inducible PhoH-like protein